MNNRGKEAALVNLAFRVDDLAEAEVFIEQTPGWTMNARHEIDGDIFFEASFGGVKVNFFKAALYDTPSVLPALGFLHVSYGVPDLASMLEEDAWSKALIWGPQVISGGFGTRKIAFFEPLPGCRIELMEEM
ncbi:VOC family protein [Shinella sp. M27]|uniref:VOC family protein n=1 Tax=Shinella sp. M27 TaxID=3368614 RepID=UPI003BA19EBB